MNADTATPAIEAGLRALVGEGAVFETRALHVARNGSGFTRTVSGYFTDPAEAARFLAAVDGFARGMYVTLNEVNPALLARAANRLREVGKADPTTADAEIVRRTRLLVDVDPVRPSGITATDAEHAAALDRARAIRDVLVEMGAPAPLLVDSGNGAQVILGIDLPADDGGLVKRVLEGLAFRFDDDAVRVDRTVYNPARIVKVPGTLTRKGDATPDRPHRRAAILEGPDHLDVTPRETLEAVAAWAPAPEARPRSAHRPGEKFDLDAWLDRHGIESRRPRPWRGGTLHSISCHRNPDHGFDAWVAQDGDGMLAAGCFHNTCTFKTWRDLKDAFEPSRIETRPAPGRPARTTEAPDVAEPEWIREVMDEAPPLDPEMAGPSTGTPWEEPVEFFNPDRAAFPVDALPEWLRSFVEAESEATQTPLDLAGCMALATVAGGLSKKFRVQAKPGWSEPINLYTAVVLPPAERKSATVADVVDPIADVEREIISAAEPVIALAEIERDRLQQRAKSLQSQAAKASDLEAVPLMKEAAEITARIRTMVVPSRPVLLADDVTPERLATVLQQQKGRIAILSPEGELFDLAAGRYATNGAPNFHVFLKGHSGDDLRVDRVGRPSEYVQAPGITIGITIQPDVLRSITGKPGFRGRGFLGRFLYSVPAPRLGSRDADSAPVPDAVRSDYRRKMALLWRTPATLDANGAIVPRVLRFSWEARDILTAFSKELEPRLGPSGDLGTINDWAGKLAGAVVRLAGILHMADRVSDGNVDPGEEVDGPTVERAISLGRYFTEHAIVAFRAMRTDQTADDAEYLLRWILEQRRAGRETFTRRDAHAAKRYRFSKAEDLDPALRFLTAHGWIRPQTSTGKRGPGRPSAVYEINPRGEVSRDFVCSVIVSNTERN
jgi:hypothetical protein